MQALPVAACAQPSSPDRPLAATRRLLTMPRNLVLCLDGTSNRFGRANTNVIKLFSALVRDAPDQLTYYQTGVGTAMPPGLYSRIVRRVVEELDMAFAILLDDHVLAAYAYLCQNWEPGDRIHLYGFSRGAFTARVLAGMVHKVGLMSRGNDALHPFAWDMYANQRDLQLAAGFKATFGRPARIAFLGLWDTVSSVGWAYAPKVFPYTMTNPSVDVVRHAMALDERRAYFPQNEWTAKPSPGQDVLQVWFAGVHGDVGGGYAEHESGLSKLALRWMTDHAAKAGLLLDAERLAAVLPTQPQPGVALPDPASPLHNSLSGLWWLVEALPKRIRDRNNNWKPRFVIPWGRHRTVQAGAAIHRSVFERLAHPPAQYAPPNLPSEHTQVP
jgi:uncharacterized protein (DUF2235 family)